MNSWGINLTSSRQTPIRPLQQANRQMQQAMQKEHENRADATSSFSSEVGVGALGAPAELGGQIMAPMTPPERESIPRRAINKAKEVRRKLPKSLKLKIKIVLSILMFLSLPLFLKVDLQRTWAALLQTNPWIIAATAALYVSSVLVMARRWQILARAVGFDKGFGQLTQYCYVGIFFNLFLPSTVGGDFSRCYYLSKGTGRYADAFYSVLADRALGIAVLFFTATVGLLLPLPGAHTLPWQLRWPVYAGLAAVMIGLPLAPYVVRKVLGPDNWIARQFNSSSATVYWQDKRLVLAALSWTLVSQVLIVICHIGVSLALGIADKIPLWYYFVFFPCVAVLGFITPSFNGIGIREWAYTYFLLLVGVDRSCGLTYAIMWLALTTFLSLFGGLVYAAAKMAPPPPQEDV